MLVSVGVYVGIYVGNNRAVCCSFGVLYGLLVRHKAEVPRAF